jgi:transketolase C-terminal domain/subunit
MRLLTVSLLALLAAGACSAQQREFGFAGGVGVFKNGTVTSATGTADAGFKPGAAMSAFFTQNMYHHVSGQIRYTFQFDDMRLSSGGTEATFKAQSHAIHYDLQFLGGSPEAPVRPYLLAGGGVKIYRGTGQEREMQDLIEYAALTRVQQTVPLVTFGGGVKFSVGRRAFLYVEARDYLTPFPKNVIAPVPPSRAGGWIHDFTPMIGLSFTF